MDEFQKERDFLEVEIAKCTDERDFEGAAWFDKSLEYTQYKLRILEKLSERDYHLLRDLKRKLSWLEYKKSNPREATDPLLIDQEILDAKRLLEQYRATSKTHLDHDELIIRIEQLITQKITFLVLLIMDNEIEIRMDIKGTDLLIINVRATKGKSLFSYTYHYGRSLMRQLGFRMRSTDLTLMTNQLHQATPLKILEILSILSFEIFPPYREKFAFLRVTE